MILAYHYTTTENARSILKEGLRKDSFICRGPGDWRGEVCLEVQLQFGVPWDFLGEWQAIVSKRIPPERIRVFRATGPALEMLAVGVLNEELKSCIPTIRDWVNGRDQS